jgi:hypothetical protein
MFYYKKSGEKLKTFSNYLKIFFSLKSAALAELLMAVCLPALTVILFVKQSTGFGLQSSSVCIQDELVTRWSWWWGW